MWLIYAKFYVRFKFIFVGHIITGNPNLTNTTCTNSVVLMPSPRRHFVDAGVQYKKNGHASYNGVYPGVLFHMAKVDHVSD